MEVINILDYEVNLKAVMINNLLRFSENTTTLVKQLSYVASRIDQDSKEFAKINKIIDLALQVPYYSSLSAFYIKKDVLNWKDKKRQDFIEIFRFSNHLDSIESTIDTPLVSYIDFIKKSLISSLNGLKDFRWSKYPKSEQYFNKAFTSLELVQERLQGLN